MKKKRISNQDLREKKVGFYSTLSRANTVDKITPPRLNIQKLEVYDNTDGKTAVIQKPLLKEVFQKQWRRGFQRGSLSGAGAVALTTLPILATSTGFQDFFGISGDTWHAIFFLLFIFSISTFIILLFVSIRSWQLDKDPVEEFFTESKKLQC